MGVGTLKITTEIVFSNNIRFDVGTDVGTDIGTDIGTDVGKDVGTHVDINVGTDVDTHVDPNVGTDVDTHLGTDVGADVGTDVLTIERQGSTLLLPLMVNVIFSDTLSILSRLLLLQLRLLLYS